MVRGNKHHFLLRLCCVSMAKKPSIIHLSDLNPEVFVVASFISYGRGLYVCQCNEGHLGKVVFGHQVLMMTITVCGESGVTHKLSSPFNIL
jgi:hypothetical protein